MHKVLLVVHRFFPYPGGSEIYMYNIARELISNVHTPCDVTVLTQVDGNKGDVIFENNAGRAKIKCVSDPKILIDEKFDLIVVHGGDVGIQNLVHAYAGQWPSPVLYMIVKPSDSEFCVKGLNNHDFIAYSTYEDMEHMNKFGVPQKKRVYMPHGIFPPESKGYASAFRAKYNIVQNDEVIFVSAGGFWPHKGFVELQQAFHRARYTLNIPSRLFLFGYSDHPISAISDDVVIVKNPKHQEILDAIAGANAYVMNSREEGFGLVLLEALYNNTRWIATNIAGAKMLPGGETYPVGDDDALYNILCDHMVNARQKDYNLEDEILERRTMMHTCNGIYKTLEELDRQKQK